MCAKKEESKEPLRTLWYKLTKKKVVMGPTDLDIIVKCDVLEPRKQWVNLLFTDRIGNAAEFVFEDTEFEVVVKKLDEILANMAKIQ